MAMKSKMQQWREHRAMKTNLQQWREYKAYWAKVEREDVLRVASERAQARAAARSLPHIMLVTDITRMQPSFGESIIAALEDGARLILVRERNVASERRASNLNNNQRCAVMITHRFGARTLLYNSIPTARDGLETDYIHFKWHALVAHSVRRAVSHGLMCGVSTHSLDEARIAQEAGAHYIVLGSIFPTDSHPGGETLGLQVLAEIAREVSIPIFAIGGINSRNARSCLDAGAYGVAAIGAAWDGEERRRLLRVVGDV